MEYVLIIIGICCCIIGLLGSIFPVLPGLPISWVGLLLIYFIPGVPFDYVFLGITLGVTVLMFALGYIIPAKGSKWFGGSKAGAVGSTVGLVLGMFLPLGILYGPFIGAFLGELFVQKSDVKASLRAAFGAFLGFLVGTFANVVASIIFLILFIYKIIDLNSLIFG